MKSATATAWKKSLIAAALLPMLSFSSMSSAQGLSSGTGVSVKSGTNTCVNDASGKCAPAANTMVSQAPATSAAPAAKVNMAAPTTGKIPPMVTSGSGVIVRSGTNLCVNDVTGNCGAGGTPAAAAAPAAPTAAKPSNVADKTAIATKMTANSMEVLFAFDKSVVSKESKTKIRDFVKSAQAKSKITSVEVDGFADRIGTTQYNQALSKRRANAVSNQLVASGVAKKLIKIKGFSENDAVTKPKQCDDMDIKAKIKCLAPDRRAVITVIQ
jgi:outer membrane protein OmpA-like peptidoglycan-associated protein